MYNNRIKMGIIFGALVLLVTATVAFAHDFGYRNGGHMRGYDYGYGHMMGPGMMGYGGYNGHMGYGGHMRGYGPWGDRDYNSNLSDDELSKLDQARESFFNDTRELRDQIREKRYSLNQEFDKNNPDNGRVAELQKELSNLESQFDQKGVEYQLKVKKLLPDKDFSGAYGPRGGNGFCW